MFLAIIFDSNIVFSSGKFKQLTNLLTSKNISIKNFYIAKANKSVWNSSEKIFITKKIRDELDTLATVAKPPEKHHWEIPIRYVILTSLDYTVTGVATEPSALS